MTDGLNTYRRYTHSSNTPCKFKWMATPVSLFLRITRSPLLIEIVVASSLLSLQHDDSNESIHHKVKVDDPVLWNHFDGCTVTLRVRCDELSHLGANHLITVILFHIHKATTGHRERRKYLQIKQKGVVSIGEK